MDAGDLVRWPGRRRYLALRTASLCGPAAGARVSPQQAPATSVVLAGRHLGAPPVGSRVNVLASLNGHGMQVVTAQDGSHRRTPIQPTSHLVVVFARSIAADCAVLVAQARSGSTIGRHLDDPCVWTISDCSPTATSSRPRSAGPTDPSKKFVSKLSSRGTLTVSEHLTNVGVPLEVLTRRGQASVCRPPGPSITTRLPANGARS